MATDNITAPTDFTVSKTAAKPGDRLTFTWKPSKALNGATIINYQVTGFNYVTGQYVGQDFMPGHTVLPPDTTSYTCTFPDYATTYIEYYVVAIGRFDGASAIGQSSDRIQVYVDNSPGPDPGPTPTPGGARLEQFQNSSAENIYPKTIVEGVFRQSDGKTLEELLEESGGSGGVESFNGRTGAVTPQTGDYTAAQVGAVPTSRKVNGQALNGDITLITCGTADLIAGSSRLAAGTLYGVYEG